MPRPIGVTFDGGQPTGLAEMSNAEIGDLWSLLQTHRGDIADNEQFLALDGEVSWLPGATVVTGVDTTFLSDLGVGDVVVLAGHRLRVDAVSSDTAATVTTLDPLPPEPVGQDAGFFVGYAGTIWLLRANGRAQSVSELTVGLSVWLPDGAQVTVTAVWAGAVSVTPAVDLDGPVRLYTASSWRAWTAAGINTALLQSPGLAVPPAELLIGAQPVTITASAAENLNVADLVPAPENSGRANGYWYQAHQFATAAGGSYVHVGAGYEVTPLDRFGAGASGA